MERGLRFAATVLSYLVYGLGALLVWWLIYPATAWRHPPAARPAYARRLSRRAFRFFVEWMRRTGVWDFHLEGAQRLRGRGRVIVANHPSFLDIVLLFAFVEDAVCVVKPSLARVPLVGRPIRCCGHILADDSQTLLPAALAALRQGANLILFPQGTRTPPEAAWRFQRSAARIALETGAPIVPVYLRYRPLLLGKGQSWHQVPEYRPAVTVTVGAEIDPGKVMDAGLPLSVAARRLTRHLERLYSDWHERDASRAPAGRR
ncbi:hypothetical protein MIT9_P0402 [Methylomarinovum caldicuralii]|uniref:Phospholipid/glycerol acyltransferase domain-containing protein n=1 Tax=Methylomarinovum caldicuralii TaxID=438856 RepID=A0AAU9C5V7_9GAMM|nr:lysophospholipid acyltransferase family protein [Methylomarinovum caldicuralii]BCX80826.1 hypothetical protein MIT9_P0402 [Methylomarinovum caldicuralii]